jgi:pyrroline-5-carboxylate reductase
MTRAIVSGMFKGTGPSGGVSVVQRSNPNRQGLINDFAGAGLKVVASASDLTRPADVVVWAVKPQVLKDVVAHNAGLFGPDCLHISVAAGVSTQALRTWLGNEQVVRCMPNTPATIGMGAAGLYAASAVSSAQRAQVAAILQATGLLVWVEEEPLLEAVTAVSGSGPAYFFAFIQAMAAAGEAMGLSAHTAQSLAIATARGAAELAAQSDETPAQLQQRVTSKGGATYEAMAVFEQADLKGIVAKAMSACADRAQAMGETFGKA